MKTWIVVANRSEAKFFSTDPKRRGQVEFVSKIENPRGRLKNGDINADRPGAFSPMSTTHGSGREASQSPVERVAQEFALEIVESLTTAKSTQEFEELVLIADPQFLGLLRNAMTKELSRIVVREEAKDLNAVTADQIRDRLYPEEPSALNL